VAWPKKGEPRNTPRQPNTKTPMDAKLHVRSTPQRMRPASIAAKALNPRHRKFADLYLSGLPAGRAYEQVFDAFGDTADSLAAALLGKPRVRTYVSAIQDQSAANVVLSQEILHGHAMVLARGSDSISPSTQMEAIQYLDGCLNRHRTIKIEGLVLNLDADESHVAAIAYAALEAEANGTLAYDDARHLIESAALVQQIMHGRTIAHDMMRDMAPVQLPKLPPPPAGSNGTNGATNGSGNGHANGSNGAGNGHAAKKAADPFEQVHSVTQHANGDVTMALPDPRPVRPKWLKTPEQIAANAKVRSAAASKGGTARWAKAREEKPS